MTLSVIGSLDLDREILHDRVRCGYLILFSRFGLHDLQVLVDCLAAGEPLVL